MSIESPKEGPTRANTPYHELTTSQLAAIMAEAPPAPLSPRSAQACADQFDGLTADMLRGVVRGLVATLHKRDTERFAEGNKFRGRIQELEDRIKKEFEVSYDMHTPPDGFEANDERRAPYARVPDKDGYLVEPKWVKYLEDGRVAAYPMGAPIDSMPYIVDIYAEPSLDDEDEPFEPMPQWYRAALHTDDAHWQILYKEKLTKWRIGASPLKSSGIATFTGSSMGWPRRSSLCRWIWKGPGRLRTYVSTGFKRPKPTNTPSTVKALSQGDFASPNKIFKPSGFCASPPIPTTTTPAKIRAKVARSSRGRLEV